MKIGTIDFNTLVSGEAQKFSIEVMDDGAIEAKIEGSTTFKPDNAGISKFLVNLKK